ncbi:Malignant T-cell-amplified sequence 1, partial [Lobosporangium transversale]
MFKNVPPKVPVAQFNIKEDVTGHTQVKSSVQRGIRAKILEQYKDGIEGIIDDVMPKKSPLILMK